MQANLLTHFDSFAWEDLSVDRSQAIEDLALALDKCSDHGDQLYGHPSFYLAVMSWGDLYQIITFDEETRNAFCPWLTPGHQLTLGKLLNRAPTVAADLAALRGQFPGGNNGWIGIAPVDIPYYVADEESWVKLHQTHVTEYYPAIDKKSAYFKRFYVPSLRTPVNQINQLIRRRQTDRMFRRIDSPFTIEDDITLHGEQTQMHFNDNGRSALNLNGEWKHGKFDLSTEVKSLLIQWGFIVPD
jgi:hypothetical protein